MNVKKVYERDCLVDLGIDGRRILKCVLKKQNVRVWTQFMWLIQVSIPVLCYCIKKVLYLIPRLWYMVFSSTSTEMDALRRSARISKLDRKTNEYIRGKMDVQDMILDDITRKQLIWYGQVERMDATWLPKIMIHWKPEGRKKQSHPQRTWKDGIYTAMNERDLRMGEWNNRRQWNMKVGRRRQTF